jgi:large subunit ribosomal protein L25
MAEITLTATTGRSTGTRNSRRLRAEGRVPGVVYGLDRDPVAVSVDWKQLRAALITDAGVNVLIDLEVEGEDEAQLSIIKEMQRHPIRQTVEHVDFLLIRRDQEISVDVPVVLEGEATEVNNNNGLLEQLIQSLTINAKPGSIPDQIVFDISGLTIGDTVTVGDLSLPSGVTTDVDPDEAVVIAQASRAAVEVEEAEAEAAAAGEAAGAAGEAASTEAESEGGDAEGGDEG